MKGIITFFLLTVALLAFMPRAKVMAQSDTLVVYANGPSLDVFSRS